jgi:hypothetical protein
MVALSTINASSSLSSVVSPSFSSSRLSRPRSCFSLCLLLSLPLIVKPLQRSILYLRLAFAIDSLVCYLLLIPTCVESLPARTHRGPNRLHAGGPFIGPVSQPSNRDDFGIAASKWKMDLPQITLRTFPSLSLYCIPVRHCFSLSFENLHCRSVSITISSSPILILFYPYCEDE